MHSELPLPIKLLPLWPKHMNGDMLYRDRRIRHAIWQTAGGGVVYRFTLD